MSNTVNQIVSWISEIWLPIVLIILLASIAQYIGKGIILATVRRTIHGRHFGRTLAPSIDVKKRQDTIISLSLVLWKSIVVIATVLALLRVIFPKVDLTPLLASAGVLGAVIGFGAQSIIKDFIAGISIITENQFRVGDEVEMEGNGVSGSGTVEHITLRGTALRDSNGNVHYIANGTVLHVINKTMGYSKVNFTLVVAPDSNIDKVAEIINEVGKKMTTQTELKTKIIEPPSFTNIAGFNDAAVELNITGKTIAGEQWSVTNEFKKKLLKELRKHPDITLPASGGLNLSAFSKKKK